MPVAIPNFEYSYRRKGKPVFVPTAISRRIGNEIKKAVEFSYTFDPVFFHLQRGGHVAAMHHHRENLLFARIDISRFFYSISRRRIQSALDRIGVGNARFYAKWSTVINPYDGPRYVLPYGFVQSPILASLVVATSQVGEHILRLPPSVSASIYMDDILLSSNEVGELAAAFDSTLAILTKDGFQISKEKLRAPAPAIDIFNCDLAHGSSVVRAERIEEFFAKGPDLISEEAFIGYCDSVANGNRT